MAKKTATATLKQLSPKQLSVRGEKVKAFWELFSKKGLPEFLASLFCRWQDEQGLEDIKEYGKVFGKSCTKSKIPGKIIKFSARPFGAIFSLGVVGGDELQVKVTSNSREYHMIFGRNLK